MKTKRMNANLLTVSKKSDSEDKNALHKNQKYSYILVQHDALTMNIFIKHLPSKTILIKDERQPIRTQNVQSLALNNLSGTVLLFCS